MPAATVVSLFNARVHALREQPALRTKEADGAWRVRSWSEYGSEVRAVARALAADGVGEGDAVAVLSGNRAEYNIVDIATLANGAVAVPIYHTNAADQVKYVLEHSSAKVVFVEDAEQLAKVEKCRGDLGNLKKVVTFSGDAADARYSELVEAGSRLDADEPVAYDEICEDVQPQDLACLIYTSGTTGPPKGVMLTHSNITWTARSLGEVLPIEDYRVVSFLPMAHIAERMVSHYLTIHYGGESWFGGSIDTLREDISAARPTVFFAVPRVYEKFEAAIRQRLAEASGVRGGLARKAREIGARLTYCRQHEERVGVLITILHAVLDHFVLSKLRVQIGFDQTEALISGAAPITEQTLQFFASLGLPIAEVYGQTEGCGPTSFNPPERIKIGTVGPPVPGCDVKIADDGEVLVAGGNVFRGYFRNEEATAETLADGWLQSGDLGELDEDGYLTITGRKKDLIITAGGKNISPQNIESLLKANPYISHAVAIGDRRKFMSALITLDADAISAWSAEHGVPGDPTQVVQRPEVRALVEAAVADANQHLSKVEQLKKFTILAHDFTQESGEITPTLKAKRNVIADKYAAEIDAMYA